MRRALGCVWLVACGAAPDLARVRPEPPGLHCPTGGQAIETGDDDDGDGVLSDAEVDQADYVCNGAAVGPLLEGSFTIESAADVATLAQLVRVTGDVILAPGAPDPLEVTGLRMIDGRLLARDGTHLASVTFTELVSVGDLDLTMAADRLALPALVRVYGDIDLAASDTAEIELGGLPWVSGSVHVQGTPRLDVGRLTTIGRTLDVPAALLPRFAALTTLGFLAITDPELTSLAPLTELTTITEWLDLRGADGLIGLDLPHLASIGGLLRVEGAPALTHLGLPALAHLGELLVRNEQGLTGLDLPDLTSVGGALRVEGAPALTHLGLPALAQVGGFLVRDGPGLTGLDLPTLTSVDGAFQVDRVEALARLGMPLLERVSGDLAVLSAGALTGLDLPRLTSAGSLFVVGDGALTGLGLPRLTAVVRQLSIRNNHRLPGACIDQLSAQLVEAPADGFDVYDNGDGDCP
jgi:hypothetical protein